MREVWIASFIGSPLASTKTKQNKKKNKKKNGVAIDSHVLIRIHDITTEKVSRDFRLQHNSNSSDSGEVPSVYVMTCSTLKILPQIYGKRLQLVSATLWRTIVKIKSQPQFKAPT